MMIKYIVRCTQGTQGRIGLSCDQMVMEYPYDEYCNMRRKMHYIIPVEFIQMLTALLQSRHAPGGEGVPGLQFHQTPKSEI
jgi:hypothetical protein